MATVHIYIKLKGKEERQILFNHILRWLDVDWPYGDGVSRSGSKKEYKECEKCKGMIYNNPVLNKEQIKAAARQCEIGVKIKQWQEEWKCSDVLVDCGVDQLEAFNYQLSKIV